MLEIEPVMASFPRVSSSTSLSSSPASSSNSSLTQHDHITIQTLTECLHKLHSLQEQESRIRKGSSSKTSSSRISMPTSTKTASTTSSGPRRLKRLTLKLSGGAKNGAPHANSEVNRDDRTADLDQEREDFGLDPDQVQVIDRLAKDRLQVLEESIELVTVLRELNTRQISPAIKSRASKLITEMQLSVDASGDQAFDLPYLFGRCFNLSMNLKILSQCNFADPSIAARIFADYEMLENSLGTQLETLKRSKEDAALMEHGFARLQIEKIH